ncbi:uncharacterized protein LOC124277895 [Haliotis rubra]|nr:uncharacterized protein LOC124277895 [Haliotis rubra]
MNHITVARPTQNRKRKPVTCQIDTTKKIPVVTETDMQVLKDQEHAPLSYMVHLTAPKVQTPVGDVQLGSFLSYQTRNIKPVTTLAHTQCKVESFPKTSPIKLPTEFQVLNDGYAVADPEQLERDTRGQSYSLLWRSSRSTRLTASNFGKIINRKKRPTTAFLDTLFPKEKQTIYAKPLEYGKKHENSAKSKYLETFQSAHMHDCGLIVNPEFSFLGATPDAKLCCTVGTGMYK